MLDHDEERRCSAQRMDVGDVGMCEMDEVRKAVGKWEVPDE